MGWQWSMTSLLGLIACHTPGPVAVVPPVESCWFDRSPMSTLFGVRRDGDLIVLRGTATSQRLSRVGRDGAVAWEAAFEMLGGEKGRSDEDAMGLRLPGCVLAKHSGIDGQLLWSRQFFGTGHQLCRDVATNAEGDAYVTGYFEATFETESLILSSAGAMDIVVLRLAGRGHSSSVGSPRGPGRFCDGVRDLQVPSRGLQKQQRLQSETTMTSTPSVAEREGAAGCEAHSRGVAARLATADRVAMAIEV